MINLSTSGFYDRSNRLMDSLRARSEQYQQQIATGQRLIRSSDDPVAAARLRTIGRRQQLAETDRQNSVIAQTNLRLTDAALGGIADVLGRARELVLQAANDTLNPSQRASIGTELEGLVTTTLQLANSRDEAGHALFGGKTAGDAYDASGTYLGTSSTTSIPIADGVRMDGTMVGSTVFGFDVAGTTTDLFKVLGDISSTLKDPNSDQSAACQAALGGLDSALERITTAQSVIGARMANVEMVDQRRETNALDAAEQQNALGGVDLADSISKFQETMTVLEASQASFVRLAGLSLFDLLH